MFCFDIRNRGGFSSPGLVIRQMQNIQEEVKLPKSLFKNQSSAHKSNGLRNQTPCLFLFLGAGVTRCFYGQNFGVWAR